MSWLKAKDISVYQGAWQDTGEPIVMIKMGGGDAGNYMDSHASINYDAAVRAGKAVGGYWFAGGTDPVAEANFFMRCMEPLAENDVYCLDWEVQHPDPVGWCETFVKTIHDKINVWPLLYINLSTLDSYDWSPVLNNCGLWLADWAVSPDANAPTNHPYVMQQYADGPGYDRDAWFESLETFQAYGWHNSVPNPQPAPNPIPTPNSGDTPPVIPSPGDTGSPTTVPTPPPVPITTPPPNNDPTASTKPTEQSWFHSLLALLLGLFGIKI